MPLHVADAAVEGVAAAVAAVVAWEEEAARGPVVAVVEAAECPAAAGAEAG